MPYKDPEAARAFQNRWRAKNKEVVNERNRNRLIRLRMEAVLALGGNCANCGEDDVRVLQIDHINGGGSAERKTSKAWGTNLLARVISGDVDGLQLLCANCHMIKTWRQDWKP